MFSFIKERKKNTKKDNKKNLKIEITFTLLKWRLFAIELVYTFLQSISSDSDMLITILIQFIENTENKTVHADFRKKNSTIRKSE